MSLRLLPCHSFDPSVPSIARVYDYFLGGKDNFAADRELAEQLMAFAPLIGRWPGRTASSSPAP